MDQQKAGGATPEKPASGPEGLLRRARYVMLIPTLVLGLGTVAVYVYAAVYAVDAARSVVLHPFPISHNIGLIIVLIDLVLVGTTLAVTAVGLYELLVGGGVQDANLPSWLIVHDLDDLEVRIASMLVLVASTSFVDVVVDFQGGIGVLYLGAGAALVIGALTVHIQFGPRSRRPDRSSTRRSSTGRSSTRRNSTRRSSTRRSSTHGSSTE